MTEPTMPNGMNVGDAVEVHVRFNDRWVGGFEVAAITDGGYELRRLSDGRLLPSPTSPGDVRQRRPAPAGSEDR